jgi:hypothetical protein
MIMTTFHEKKFLREILVPSVLFPEKPLYTVKNAYSTD